MDKEGIKLIFILYYWINSHELIHTLHFGAGNKGFNSPIILKPLAGKYRPDLNELIEKAIYRSISPGAGLRDELIEKANIEIDRCCNGHSHQGQILVWTAGGDLFSLGQFLAALSYDKVASI